MAMLLRSAAIANLIFASVVGSASAGPAEIVCAYEAFGSSGELVIQRLIWDGDAYVEPNVRLALRYQILSESDVTIQLANGAGGAITAFAIEKSDGSMIKISAATFSSVEYRRGRCRLG